MLLYRMNEKNEKSRIYVCIYIIYIILYHQYSEITSDFNLLQVFMLNEEQCSSFNINTCNVFTSSGIWFQGFSMKNFVTWKLCIHWCLASNSTIILLVEDILSFSFIISRKNKNIQCIFQLPRDSLQCVTLFSLSFCCC